MPDSTKLVLIVLGAGLSAGFWFAAAWRTRVRRGQRLPQVRVYDAATGTTRLMPSAELAPGMVATTVPNVPGIVWVDAAQLEEGQHRHPPLSPALRSHVWRIYHALWDVYPQSIQEWEDGFRRDVDPALEIAIWLHVAQAYEAIAASRAMTPAQKRDVFNVLVACSMTPREHLFSTVALQAISKQEAEDAIRVFDGLQGRRSGVPS